LSKKSCGTRSVPATNAIVASAVRFAKRMLAVAAGDYHIAGMDSLSFVQ
jgi:hypothetical protein